MGDFCAGRGQAAMLDFDGEWSFSVWPIGCVGSWDLSPIICQHAHLFDIRIKHLITQAT